MSKTLKVLGMGKASDARRAGVQIGDTILSYNCMLVSTNEELSRTITITNEIGVISAELVVVRKGEEFKYNLILDNHDMKCVEIGDKGASPSRIVNRSHKQEGTASFVSFLG